MENKEVISDRNIKFNKIPVHCNRWRLKRHRRQEKKTQHQVFLIAESCTLLPLQPYSSILLYRKSNWNEQRKVSRRVRKSLRIPNRNKFWTGKNTASYYAHLCWHTMCLLNKIQSSLLQLLKLVVLISYVIYYNYSTSLYSSLFSTLHTIHIFLLAPPLFSKWEESTQNHAGNCIAMLIY